jgi:hypothetical protein
MGERGPVPKRSTQRRRRNKDATPTKSAVSTGDVRGPELEGDHCDVALRFWDALRRSGQTQFFEPSDWAAAELVVIAIDTFASKPTALMLSSINSAMSNLLVTEGDRRRVRLELERGEVESEGAPDVSELAEYRRRLSS